MTFMWDAKNNFILLHSIICQQEQSSTLDINWLMIADDINLEICSTALLLKIQYENLLETFYPIQDSKTLYGSLKHIYLHSLCQKIEDDLKLTLVTVYELIRHARAKRITVDNIEQLITEWNFKYSSNDQKKNKERLYDILNRLRDYIRRFPCNDYQPIHYYLSEQKDMQDDELESISDNEVPMSTDNISSNREKSSPTRRRRARSLTVITENKDNKVNIGIEWFVPKLKRQQRSLSLHARSQSPIDSSSSQNQNPQPTGILMTTIDNDNSSDSISNSDFRQTHTQPTISWLPLTDEQVVRKELKFIDGQQLDEISSSDSDSIEIQWVSSSTNEVSESSSHNLNQQEHSLSKRQRLS